MKKYISIGFALEVMRSSLITILLSSEKRTDLLLFLKDKPRTIEEINSELETNSVAVLPQLKKLKENGLVIQADRVYSLSLLGKILVRRMESLVKAFRLLEDNYDYWTGVRPGGAPLAFFELMEELMALIPDCCQGEDASSAYQKMVEAFCSSKQVLLLLSNPDLRYLSICADNTKKGLKVSIIFTQPVFEKFTEEFKEEFDTLLLLENFEIYVLNDNIIPPTLAVTDTMVLACFSTGRNDGSENKTIIGFGEKAVIWGQETFEYFGSLAKPVLPGKSGQSFS
ncbi:MAG TPA: winged helix-turn-helix domain-containing protein [Methanosarcina sp.]|nr:winged helix-turn-helix domain-containing protein [Methanosarcina sp.]